MQTVFFTIATRVRQTAGAILLALPIAFLIGQNAAGATSADAELMRSQYASLAQRLEHNQFERPLVLDSVESRDRLEGDIYAVVDHPYTETRNALTDPPQWCEVMILHLNTKYCRAVKEATVSGLKVNIGKKTPQALADSERIMFNFAAMAATPDYFEVALSAQNGPLGTSDYRIALRAIPLGADKTFIRLTYSYSTGMMGRIAMQAYLGTIGHDKVGFTVVGKEGNGSPQYVGGVRGVIERNTMRYFLAIDSYLESPGALQERRFDGRLKSWFFATEHYARQLHELDWNEYAEMKHAEHARMLAEP